MKSNSGLNSLQRSGLSWDFRYSPPHLAFHYHILNMVSYSGGFLALPHHHAQLLGTCCYLYIFSNPWSSTQSHLVPFQPWHYININISPLKVWGAILQPKPRINTTNLPRRVGLLYPGDPTGLSQSTTVPVSIPSSPSIPVSNIFTCLWELKLSLALIILPKSSNPPPNPWPSMSHLTFPQTMRKRAAVRNKWPLPGLPSCTLFSLLTL